jgi:hypothetical protein
MTPLYNSNAAPRSGGGTVEVDSPCSPELPAHHRRGFLQVVGAYLDVLPGPPDVGIRMRAWLE